MRWRRAWAAGDGHSLALTAWRWEMLGFWNSRETRACVVAEGSGPATDRGTLPERTPEALCAGTETQEQAAQSKETVRRSTPVAKRGCPQQGHSGSLAMHLSPEFTQDSALAAAVGGMGIGAVATIFAQTNQRLLPSATPDAEVWTGMVAGAFALVSNPFFALVDETSFEGDSLRGLGLVRLGVAGLLVGAGSKLGAGCTCGNGIQGLACFSKASFGFVLVFMATGALAAYLVGNDFAPASAAPFSWPLARAVASIAVAQFFMRTNKKVSNVLGGCGFAASLVLAAMVKPSKIEGFLHFTAARGWDPSLAFVMGGALLVVGVAWRVLGLVDLPPMRAYAGRPLDAKTLVGGACFGAGWGLGGLCPGPGVVSVGTGSLPAAVWLGAMVAGRGLAGTAPAAKAS